MRGTVRLANLHVQYGIKVEFLMVYIREAHPTGGWWLGGGVPGAAMKIAGLRSIPAQSGKKILERGGIEAIPG